MTKKTFLLCFLIVTFCNSDFLRSQPSPSNTIYNWFDNNNGKENLAIYNGRLHVNLYRTLDKEDNMYFQKNEFTKGDISFDGQFYYDIDLKYDIYTDALIVKPANESYKAINVIKQKTQSFVLNGKHFANLAYGKKNIPTFVNGYYEVNLTATNFTFYIKHHKDIRQVIKDVSVFSSFEENDDYLLYYKNAFYEISSQKNIANLFPEYKTNIRKFYADNNAVANTDETAFMENLMKYISTLSK
jgi:hypothetical protein